MERGTVKWYNSEKGYGFITMENQKDIFVHRSGLVNTYAGLDEGAEVEFEVKDGEKGPIAVNVKKV